MKKPALIETTVIAAGVVAAISFTTQLHQHDAPFFLITATVLSVLSNAVWLANHLGQRTQAGA